MLENVKLMAIIRDVKAEYALKIIDILAHEGVRDFEISLSNPEVGFECIDRAVNEYKGADINIGAGTVSKKEEIDELYKLNVPYILTPGFDKNIVTYAQSKKMEILPGVLTPTDVQMAVNCGIKILKLFPADAFGSGYIKALKGPFPETDYVAVGGVTLQTAKSFFDNGFSGIAVGSNLVPRGATKKDFDAIKEIGRRYVEIVR